jgi:hypothetical protein
VPLLVTAVAAVVFVVGTIGPPLFGRGVFLSSDLIHLAYPWKAYQEPGELDTAKHGPTSDTVDAVYPSLVGFAEAARDGHFQGWDPYVSGGHPLGSTSQSATLSPMSLPFLVAPVWYAPALLKLVGLAVSIGFTYLFCRRLGTQRVPAVLAGVAFAGSGFMVMWTNWQHVGVAALIPALFWGAERFLQVRTLISAVPIALAVAAMLLGYFPAVAGYGLFVLAGYVALRLLAERRQGLRHVVSGAATVGASLVVGALLVAAVVLPFAARLGDENLEHRAQSPDNNLGIATLMTTVAPGAFGLSSDGLIYRGRGPNQVEAIAFLGAGVVLLALAAVALPGSRRTPGGARVALVAATGVLGVATFLGGPLLDLLQVLPIFGGNYIGRTRSVLGFTVAVLAALGFQALLERRRPVTRPQLAWCGAVVAAAAVLAGIVAVRTVHIVRPFDRAYALGDSLRWPVALGVAALAAAAAVWLGRGWLRALGTTALPVLLVAESLLFALPLLPNEDRSTLYPETAATRFLKEHVGADRVGVEGQAYYGNTPMLYGFRVPTGHVFHAPTWADMLRTIDGESFARSPTLAKFSGEADVVTSPALDRLGARWFAASPETPPLGQREARGLAEASCPPSGSAADGTGAGAAAAGPAATARVPAGDGLRGVVVRICDHVPVPPGSKVVVRASDDRGRTAVGELWRRAPLAPSEVVLALPADDLAGDGEVELAVTLADAPGVALPLATGADGGLAVDVVRPDDDGLRLAYAADMRIYERLNGLPRIRWAGTSEVLTRRDDRLARLASGELDDDTVLLSEGEPGGSGRPGEVSVVTDGSDELVIEVVAEGDGYLVLADALQDDWSATVDGHGQDLLDADHAGVALALPAGEHRVELRHTPRGQRVGLLLGLVAAATLVATVVVSWRRRRGDTPSPPGATPADLEPVEDPDPEPADRDGATPALSPR